MELQFEYPRFAWQHTSWTLGDLEEEYPKPAILNRSTTGVCNVEELLSVPRWVRRKILLIKTGKQSEPDIWKNYITTASSGPSTYPLCAHGVLPHGSLALTWCSSCPLQPRSPLQIPLLFSYSPATKILWL